MLTAQVILYYSCIHFNERLTCNSVVQCSIMQWWVVGSIIHGGPIELFHLAQTVLHIGCNKGRGMCYPVCGMVHIKDPVSYFSFQPVLHIGCNKGRGMCYPVGGMGQIKDPSLLIGKSSPCCGGSGFPLSLSEWFFTICLRPHKMCWVRQ